MTDHLSFEQLCDLADSVLPPAAETAARAHLRTCEECISRFAAISALAASTAALPQAIAPPEGLWDDIRKELKPRHQIGRRGGPTFQVRQLAAAAVVIAVASSTLTALILREQRTRIAPSTPLVVAVPQTEPAQLPARLASDENRYARSADALQRALAERRASLAPSTIATVERSLRVADSAIAEARTALARDPANRALAALFASNYERKIDLLRRATELAPRT
jgi:hypothetical protein